ncbi:MAG: nucleotidyltransferase domain-containing protein [archaeon]
MEKKILQLAKEIYEKYNPKEIILFGSHARNTQNKHSDIDLLIVKKTNKKFNKRTEEVLNLVDCDLDLDIFVYTPEELSAMKKKGNYFIEKALSEGVKI